MNEIKGAKPMKVRSNEIKKLSEIGIGAELKQNDFKWLLVGIDTDDKQQVPLVNITNREDYDYGRVMFYRADTPVKITATEYCGSYIRAYGEILPRES